MKIYFIVYNIYGMGGTVKTTVNTVNYLVNNGYNVEVISLRRTSKEPLFKIDKKVKVTPLMDVRRGYLYSKNSIFFKKLIKKCLLSIPSLFMDKNEDLYKMFSLFSDIKLVSKLRKIKVGVVVTTIPSLNIISTRVLRKNVIKIGQEHKPYDAHHKELQNRIKCNYDKLDVLTCLTDRDYNYYKNLNKNVFKIENGINLEPQKAKLDNKCIISAGRFSNEKGFDMLLEAFSIVVKKHPDWKLVIFGEGKEKEKLKSIIIDKCIYNNVMLMPKSNKLSEEMLEASMYVLSSRYESFGMVLLEAMTLGIPCVSYDCAGPKEIIKDGEDGILVPEGDIEALAEGINNLIEDKNLRKNLGDKAKKDISRYSLEKIGDKWRYILNNISKNIN
ncbi:glycosyltransferase family 4 protein [Clostridium botulinum]|uniref:Glycosyltransferase family 4 protein n=1 Tax=Clostridium botulinum TaxID=1491 RepID=A0A6M0SP05_CLOBO|nr:glycosyltransferase family 4 protein [Clostridium botulinum]